MGERSSALVVGVLCSARVQAPGSKRGDSARRSSDGGEHEEEVERDCPRLWCHYLHSNILLRLSRLQH